MGAKKHLFYLIIEETGKIFTLFLFIASVRVFGANFGCIETPYSEPKIRTTFFIFPKSMTIGDTLSWHRS